MNFEGMIAAGRRQGYVWTIHEGGDVRMAWFNHASEAL